MKQTHRIKLTQLIVRPAVKFNHILLKLFFGFSIVKPHPASNSANSKNPPKEEPAALHDSTLLSTFCCVRVPLFYFFYFFFNESESQVSSNIMQHHMVVQQPMSLCSTRDEIAQ